MDVNTPEGGIKTIGFAANQHANYRAVRHEMVDWAEKGYKSSAFQDKNVQNQTYRHHSGRENVEKQDLTCP